MPYQIDDFKLDLRACVSPPHQIWVTSGYSTCSPLAETAAGVSGCFSPPFAGKDTRLLFALYANGHKIPDCGDKGKNDCGLLFSGGVWYPDRIVRSGTYHYKVDGKLLSFGVTSELFPLTGKAGFLVKLTIQNRTDSCISLDVLPLLEPGTPHIHPLSDWEFMPPQAPETLSPARQTGQEGIWENNQVRLTLLSDHNQPQALESKKQYTCHYAVVFTKSGEFAPLCESLSLWQMETTNAWTNKLKLAGENLPVLSSTIDGLADYYKRSLISNLVCLWENDGYITKPFPATSGIDGGSLCCYPWDAAGYSARTLVMLLGDQAVNFIHAMLKSGIDKHISMALDGSGLGWCSYSYSMWSIVNLFLSIIAFCGKGYELLDDIVRIFLQEEERLPEWECLKDYGQQHNLLEMRTCGYEYYVCSPNAERAWCYDKLAEVASQAGKKGFEVWHEKAAAIRKSIQTNLWDNTQGWFRSIHPHGEIEMVYTIQVYDALRLGACTKDMAEAITSHLRNGAFLGAYGVSSISAEDTLHYELNDPDWSGGGAYSGDGPNLAETLWQNGYSDLAFSVLQRHFWMGKMLPYYPQEHYCDKPAVPSNKRANIIAGAAGMEAVLFGMFGIEPNLDGTLKINPHPPREGEVRVTNFVHRGTTYDIALRPDYVEIHAEGSLVYAGEPKEISCK